MDLINPKIIRARCDTQQMIQLPSITFSNLKFGAKMTSSGQGAVSDDSVADQGVVETEPLTETYQVWG